MQYSYQSRQRKEGLLHLTFAIINKEVTTLQILWYETTGTTSALCYKGGAMGQSALCHYVYDCMVSLMSL